jgi:hypothetical protein
LQTNWRKIGVWGKNEAFAIMQIIQKLIIKLVFEKNANFYVGFVENRRKL